MKLIFGHFRVTANIALWLFALSEVWKMKYYIDTPASFLKIVFSYSRSVVVVVVGKLHKWRKYDRGLVQQHRR
ncbi:hypothetical protein F7U67_001822 [Vibrio metschnikovii]|uniref:Uncharacterized protein n=3 Tax=Unclassified Bacteria TaxID=49928 RepID=A0AAU6UTE0_UNCXX|nr:hypothetical protein [Vibrio metschnikovii]EKO3592562.1 hypothetical protein [Vibrio metschnikovii]EKO3642230.1 hypothetical protein [Vibrio metschnikovii]EKO3665479.1 hypothetical protein [Vibrio metschnikovii]EKO3696035.1 hypothetical protein [Vibrio metschnikovii]